MINREDITGLAGSLRTLANYLLLAKEDTDKEFIFLWDWEMIFEAVYPFRSSSIYSGILWYGLECLRMTEHANDTSWKVVIPEGSRDELRAHLERVRLRYTAILDRSKQSLQFQGSNDSETVLEYDRKDYSVIRRDIQQLRTLDLAMARLYYFLQTYARPLPYAREELPATTITYYEDRLNELRRDSEDIIRNKADALNLASTEMLGPDSKSDQPKHAALITATKAVAKRAPGLARDPIFFRNHRDSPKEFPVETRTWQGHLKYDRKPRSDDHES